MKRAVYLAAILCFASEVSRAENREQIESIDLSSENIPTKRPGLDAKTQKILAQFANIVLGFLGIVQDPNNATNVKDRVTEMVNNAVNIVSEAVKKGTLSLDATEEEVEEFAREAIRKKLIVIE